MTLGLVHSNTGGDSSNKGCFGIKTNLFRESGDFAGNRETWEICREIWDIFGTLSKDLILHVIKQYIYSERAVFTWLSKVIEELVWFWFYYALWLASVFTLVLVLRQSSENRSMHPVYALYSMYFDTWKRLNSPWYEKTNQQRFQLK